MREVAPGELSPPTPTPLHITIIKNTLKEFGGQKCTYLLAANESVNVPETHKLISLALLLTHQALQPVGLRGRRSPCGATEASEASPLPAADALSDP